MKQVTTILLMVMVSGAAFASNSKQASSTKVAWEPNNGKTECARLQQVSSLTESTAAVSRSKTVKGSSANDGRD